MGTFGNEYCIGGIGFVGGGDPEVNLVEDQAELIVEQVWALDLTLLEVLEALQRGVIGDLT